MNSISNREKATMSSEKFRNCLSRNKGWIKAFTLIIVQLGSFVLLERYGLSLQNKTVKMKCNNPNINYPMAPERSSQKNNILLSAGMILWWIMTLSITCSEMISFYRRPRRRLTIRFPDDHKSEYGPVNLLIRWICVMLNGFLFVYLLTFFLSYYFGRLAPNFVSACKPLDLDRLCPPWSDDFVTVTCTTSPDIWMRARSSFPPPDVVLQAFLTFSAAYFLKHRFNRSGWKQHLNTFCTAICVLVALSAGYNAMVFHEATWFGVILAYCIGGDLALAILKATFVWMKWGDEPGKPYHWNDVIGRRIIPRTGTIPTTGVPMWHRNPEQSKEKSPIGSNVRLEFFRHREETRQPPPYQPVIFPSYSSLQNNDRPPAYDELDWFNQA